MNDTAKNGTAIPTTLESYPFWTSDTIRFQDIDHNDHVNNIAFAIYSETGRTNFIDHLIGEFGDKLAFVVARLTVDYLAQSYFPGNVEIGTAVQKIGTKSCTLAQAVFCKSECVATSKTIWVYFNHKENRSEIMPDDVRDLLPKYQLKSL